MITGACGHIGSYIVENIKKIKKVKEVTLVDNLSSKRYSSLFNLKSKKKVKINFSDKDISQKNALNNFKKVDVVIHCASLTNAEESFNIKKKMFKNNLNCMKSIIDFCIKKKSKLIHISSTSVYGKKAKIVKENDRHLLKPQSPYAQIKLIEEKMLKKKHKRLKYMTFRFGTIAGVSKGIRFHTAVNKFCFNASTNGKIKVYKTAYNQYRPYLSIRDAFKVFKFCIEKNIFINETFNALTGNFTVKQILNKIRKNKKKINIQFVNSPIMNQLSYLVDSSKIKKLGLNLNSNIETDIKKTLDLFNW
tara:strand:- start:193 stop:1107 length:915 start_codon:yes stop_codon:yes gene_type:complete